MATTLSGLLGLFINDAPISAVSLGNEFAIVENPTFAILPNYPYRSPLVVAIYCTVGCGKGRINTTLYNLRKGDFMIVLPRQITEMVDLSNDFEATYIIMSDSFTSSLNIGNTFSLSEKVASSPHITLEGRAKESLESYIAMCRSLISEEHNPNRLEILQLLTKAFFLGLGYFIHNADSGTESRYEVLTKKFLGLVEQSYTEHRDLSFYAEQLNISAKHLSRVVKEVSGKSATEWIEKYVILDASSQLRSTSLTIKEIAYRLNFPSQSCFGKYFCRLVGVSPANYREQKGAAINSCNLSEGSHPSPLN